MLEESNRRLRGPGVPGLRQSSSPFIRNVDEVLTLLFQDRTSSAQMGGITEEFIKKLSEKVNLLTMERKSQGKTVPEDQVMAGHN